MGTTCNVVVLISGSGSNLQALIDSQHEGNPARIRAVIANRADAFGLTRAKGAGIPTAVLDHKAFDGREAFDAALMELIDAHAPDLVILAGFMRILGPAFLAQFEGRTINTHPSLLPSFPGAHAVKDALAHGVKVTGCTVHYVDAGLDSGRIIAQRAVEVNAGDTEAELHERIKKAEREQIVELLHNADIVNGKAVFNVN